MDITTVKVKRETKKKLDRYKENPNESYDYVINKLIYIVENVEKNEKLSKEALRAIREARKRIKKGKFVDEEEARKRLGL